MAASTTKPNINGRPILIASYVNTDVKQQYKTPIRELFPTGDYLGGHSNGILYESIFAGGSLEQSYDMIKSFLQEEGYGDLPIPKDAEELIQFRLRTRNRQVLMFEDNGYVHNPIKILFPIDRRKKTTLILRLYNEKAERHLTRFHNVHP